ncbi:MAG: 3,4-dihydroxyphenylacetate 2,3-dioxygenase (EC [uncultured Paraburkholderia sp.]|nr:MAG: 3,4-dihydroxyphenylacetate 2,3-dioxygenase (EC [uncultured Paraburkholderia sp.]
MGKLALSAKVTHVPSLYLSELDGPHKGCRQPAIDGHHEIGRRCRELGVDTIVVFDVHWLVNSEYHINCAPKFEGVYTSNELPHFIRNMPYAYPGNVALGNVALGNVALGNVALGNLIAEVANEMGVKSRAHSGTTLELEYGTLVPMRYMNSDQHFKAVSVAGWCMWHQLETSARFGLAVRKAIEERYDGTVAILASGSLSHHFADNGTAEQFMHKVWNPFLDELPPDVGRLNDYA